MKSGAPALEESVRVGRAREGREGLVLALEGRGRAAEAEASQRGRRRAVPRGEPWIEGARVLGGVVGPCEEPRGLLHRETEGDGLALWAEPEQVAGGRRRAEGAAYGARVKATVV